MTQGDVAAVTLVVVTWRSASVIRACLESFQAAVGDRPHSIVVVDNGTPDGVADAVAELAPGATFVQNAVNRGLPAANNQGFAAAEGDFVLVSNPDVRWLPGSVDALVACAERHPRAGFVVPRLVHPDGSLQPGAGDLPSFREALAGRVAQHRRGSTVGFWWDGWAHDEERPIGHGSEAAYLVRRAAIRDAGVQDERYVLDWEGIEWARRMGRASWEIWFCPAATVAHEGGVSIRQAHVRWIVGTHRGIYHYFSDGRPVVARAAIGAAVGVRMAVKLVAHATGAALYERSRPRASRRP